MTKRADFEEVIRKRLESLGKKPKPPEKPVKDPESLPDTDEGGSEGKGSEKALKAKQKRLRGHVKVRGRGKSRK